MKDFQKRVVTEKRELDQRLTKLAAFIETAIFRALPKAERDRLERQRFAMGAYSAVLGERIAAFAP